MTTISPPTRVLLALSALKGVGPAALKKVGALPAFWELSFEQWCKAVPQVAKSAYGQSPDMAWQAANDWAGEQAAAAERHDARIMSPLDDEYPKLLAATKDDPLILFVKGRFAENPQKSVAIIGTREPTEHGQRIAQRITQFFVEQRWSVVSGLAIGCDAIAHQMAIEAGGHTIAVLAHGLQMIAPSRHKKLAQDILDAGGALVSEYAFGRNVLGAQFVKRDRTQAGMSQGVVMIQSDLKGGSLHASRAAIDYQRWLAVPYPTDKDRKNGEPKILANLVIAEGTDAQRADLLRCPMSSLNLIRVVRGREDYLRLIEPGDSRRSAFIDSAMVLSNEEALAIDEVPEYSLEPQRNNAVLVSSSSRERPLLVEPHTESAPELEPHVEDLVSHLEAMEHTGETATPPQVTASYYLEVRTEDLENLKIAYATAGGESGLRVHLRDDDIDVVLALSRLDYLQVRLDELRKILSPKRLIDRKRVSRSRFQIEDVLTHMKRAVDELVHLDHGISSQSLRSIVVRHGSASGQPKLPLLGAEEGELRDTPLVDVLERLVDTLPRWVSIHDYEKAGDPPAWELRNNVHLNDLVFSLNELIKAVLVNGDSAHPPR